MDRALDVGSVGPEVVAVEARRSLGRPLVAPVVNDSWAFDRPAPTLSGYDALLEVG